MKDAAIEANMKATKPDASRKTMSHTVERLHAELHSDDACLRKQRAISF